MGQQTLAAGTTSWVVPAGVTSLTVTLWGAGGGGATRSTTGYGGGGGGGGVTLHTLTVTPGQTVWTSIPAGGPPGTTRGRTWINVASNAEPTTTAQGATANAGASVANNTAAGGAGGSTSGALGTTLYAGGSGASVSTGTVGSGGGSSAGTAANGVSATTQTGATAPTGGGNGGNGGNNANASPGQTPGGGGGGCYRSSGTRTGGTGGAAQILVEWDEPPPSVTLNPSNQSIDAGATATFTAAADNATSVQWQQNTGGGWSNVTTGTGGTTTSYTTAVLQVSDSGTQYRAAFTGPGGGPVFTSAATVTVNAVTLTATVITPSDNFDDNSLDTSKWETTVVSPASFAEAGGRFEVTIPNTGASLRRVYLNGRRAAPSDFRGKVAFIRVVTPPVAPTRILLWVESVAGALGTPALILRDDALVAMDDALEQVTLLTSGLSECAWLALEVSPDGGKFSYWTAPSTASDPPLPHEWQLRGERPNVTGDNFASAVPAVEVFAGSAPATTQVVALDGFNTGTVGSGAYSVTADGAAYAYTAGVANLLFARRLVADGASYAYAAGNANLLQNRRLVADGATYGYAAGNANLTASRRLVADGASYGYSAGDTSLTYTPNATAYTLVADGASYGYSAGDAGLTVARRLVADGAAYAYTAGDAGLTYTPVAGAYTLTAEGAVYGYSAGDVAFAYSGARPTGAAGWDSRKRRRRIVVEVDGKALWFETLEEAQAAIDAMPEPAEAPRPRVKVKVKPAVKPAATPEAAPQPVAEPIDVSGLQRWADEWNRMAAFEAQAAQMVRSIREAQRAAQEADDDDEEAILLLL